MTRREFAKAGVAAALVPGAAVESLASPAPSTERYRPQIHYSPTTGFMNDPNGLIYAQGEYHLFYQYNPSAPVAGHVHWGHAVSPDLLRWTDLPIVLRETSAGQAFSGSAVHDSKADELVLIYTRAGEARQTQEIATSVDHGRTFTEFAGNPVLDVRSGSFRDPKVFWHAPTGRWIMAVVHAREHTVGFYASPDLRAWTELSRFGPAGITGVDYECLDLVLIPSEGGDPKWVLFVSINPGAPQGGSAVQYLVGEFDGTRFIPDQVVTRFLDFGKDFYALQTYADAPDADTQGAIGIAWTSNWQYCNETPTGEWRGVMSLPRRMRLRPKGEGHILVQSFVGIEALRGDLVHSVPIDFVSRDRRERELSRTSVPRGKALEVSLSVELGPGAIAFVRFANRRGERLDVGYDAGAMQYFLDRGRTRGFENRFFTDKASAAADPEVRRAELQIVFDRCTLELIGQSGEIAATSLHFFESPVDRVGVHVVGNGSAGRFEVSELRLPR